MVQFFTDLLFTAKARVEKQVAFDLQVSNFNRDLTACSQIPGSVDRGGGGGRNKVLKGVVINLTAGKDGWHNSFYKSEPMAKALKKSYRRREEVIKTWYGYYSVR